MITIPIPAGELRVGDRVDDEIVSRIIDAGPKWMIVTIGESNSIVGRADRVDVVLEDDGR